MNRDWIFAALSLPLAGTAVALLWFVNFEHTPRVRRGTDVVVISEGCLDRWCRARDVVPVATAAILLAAALAVFVWGVRAR